MKSIKMSAAAALVIATAMIGTASAQNQQNPGGMAGMMGYDGSGAGMMRWGVPTANQIRIDGVILRGAAWQLCCQQLGLLAEPVHPCSAPSGCELRCNISDTIRVGGEDAARQTQLHSPSNPA